MANKIAANDAYLHGEQNFEHPLEEFTSYMLTLYPLQDGTHSLLDGNAMVDYIIKETDEVLLKESSNWEEKPRILFPIRVKRGFRLGLGLNISLIQLMISNGHRVDVLWKDESFTFEENPGQTTDLVNKLERLVRKLIKGFEHNHLRFHRETEIRRKLIENKDIHSLYRLRLLGFWDLIERKPPNLGRKDQPWNPGGNSPEGYLVAREIDELLSIHLFPVYEKLNGNFSSMIVIQGFDRIIYDLEAQRSLRLKVLEINDPNMENFASELEESLPKMIYMPPLSHLYNVITPGLAHDEISGDRGQTSERFGEKVERYLSELEKNDEFQVFYNIMEAHVNSRSGSGVSDDIPLKAWKKERCKLAIKEMGQLFESSTQIHQGNSEILNDVFKKPKDVIEILKFLTVKGGAEEKLEKQLKYMLNNLISQKNGVWYYHLQEERWVDTWRDGAKPTPYYEIQGDNNEKNAWAKTRVEAFNDCFSTNDEVMSDKIVKKLLEKDLFIGANPFFRIAMKTKKGPILISPTGNGLHLVLDFEKIVNYLNGEWRPKK